MFSYLDLKVNNLKIKVIKYLGFNALYSHTLGLMTSQEHYKDMHKAPPFSLVGFNAKKLGVSHFSRQQ